MSAPAQPWLLLLPGDELAAIPLLFQFAAEHPGVTIITPDHHSEPWRAEISEGMVPGEHRATSGFLVERFPAELLRKLEKVFSEPDPPDSS